MSDVADLKAEVLALRAENAELREHVRMPDEPLEIDEKDFYVRAFIKWATEEQPEVKRLEAENEKLQDENERLRSCLSDSAENSKQIMHEAHVQEEENAKLRELVRKVEHYEQLGCHDCPHGGSCDADTLYDERCAMSREIEREKRELGIEVDA